MEQSQTSAARAAKVLIISDEPVGAKIWGFASNQLGLEAVIIGANDPVIDTWGKELPDLIVIEDTNDRTEEIAIMKQLRELTVVPVLYMTSKASEAFHLRVYQAGADECIPCPVSSRMFQAKISAWIRRAGNIPMSALDEVHTGGFALSASQRRLSLPCGDDIRLTVLEARALFLFMSHPGRAFNNEEVIEKVWGYANSGDTSLLKHLIFRLRRKIEPDPNRPRYLRYERSTGYSFVVSAEKNATA